LNKKQTKKWACFEEPACHSRFKTATKIKKICWLIFSHFKTKNISLNKPEAYLGAELTMQLLFF
jgi:hypothetical protein